MSSGEPKHAFIMDGFLGGEKGRKGREKRRGEEGKGGKLIGRR